MNINCVNKCIYQKDGKCTMQELPRGISYTSDCPYEIGRDE